MLKEFMPHSAAWMADCLIKRYGLLTRCWSYDYGVIWRGMEALYALTGDRKYIDYMACVNPTSGKQLRTRHGAIWPLYLR